MWSNCQFFLLLVTEMSTECSYVPSDILLLLNTLGYQPMFYSIFIFGNWTQSTCRLSLCHLSWEVFLMPDINTRHIDITKPLSISYCFLQPNSFQWIVNKSNLLPPIKRVWKISFKSQIRLDPRESKPSPGQTSFVTSFLGLELSKLSLKIQKWRWYTQGQDWFNKN